MISVHNFRPLAVAVVEETRTQASSRVRVARHFDQCQAVKRDRYTGWGKSTETPK